MNPSTAYHRNTISSRAPSTTQPTLHGRFVTVTCNSTYYIRPVPVCQGFFSNGPSIKCRSVKHRLQQVRKEQSRERWRFAKQIQPDLDCGKKEIQWEGAVRQSLPNSLGCFISRRTCSSWLYHMTPAYFASTWLGDCMPRHVMIWSLDCRWYTASCFLPSSRLYIRICR